MMDILICSSLLLIVFPNSLAFDLTLIYTNDVHSRFNETNKYGGRCMDPEGKCYGGIARQKTMIDTLRHQYPNTLLMDAGDQFQGTLWFYKYGGELVSWSMKQLGYDIMALGNHEFDRKIEGLASFLRNISFPIVSCNIDVSQEPEMKNLYKPYHIFTVNGERIGVIGYTSRLTPMLSFTGSLIFTDEVESVRKYVQILQNQNINKIIALGHSGYSMDRRIAREVEGIDIVVGAHSHTFLYTGDEPSNEKSDGSYPTIVTQASGAKVPVVTSYKNGKYLGFLQVTFDNQGVLTNYSGNPILLDSSIEQDKYLKNKTDEYGAKLLLDMNKVVGRTLVHLEGNKRVCRLKECNMGNLIADGLVHQSNKHAESGNGTKAFIALVPGGDVRNSFDKGVITGADIMDAQPYMNLIETVKLQGKYLRQALEQSVTDYDVAHPKGRFLQVSGLRVVYDLSKSEGNRVASVHVKCSDCDIPEYVPLDDNVMYAITMAEFILNGGDGYTMIRDHAVKDLIIGYLDVEVLMEYVKTMSPIAQGLEGRIKFKQEVCKIFVINDSPVAFAPPYSVLFNFACLIYYIYIA